MRPSSGVTGTSTSLTFRTNGMTPQTHTIHSLEHKEHYDIIIGEEWYIMVLLLLLLLLLVHFVLQQIKIESPSQQYTV